MQNKSDFERHKSIKRFGAFVQSTTNSVVLKSGVTQMDIDCCSSECIQMYFSGHFIICSSLVVRLYFPSLDFRYTFHFGVVRLSICYVKSDGQSLTRSLLYHCSLQMYICSEVANFQESPCLTRVSKLERHRNQSHEGLMRFFPASPSNWT